MCRPAWLFVNKVVDLARWIQAPNVVWSFAEKLFDPKYEDEYSRAAHTKALFMFYTFEGIERACTRGQLVSYEYCNPNDTHNNQRELKLAYLREQL